MDGGVPFGGIRRVVVRERRRRLRTHFGGYRDRRGGGYAELREDQADDRTGERGLLQDRQADADLRIRVCGPRRHRPSGLHRGARRSGRGSFRADVGRPDAQGGVLLRRGGTRRLRPADYGSHVRTFHDRLRFVAGRSPLRDESRRDLHLYGQNHAECLHGLLPLYFRQRPQRSHRGRAQGAARSRRQRREDRQGRQGAGTRQVGQGGRHAGRSLL